MGAQLLAKTLEEEESFGQSQISSHTHVWSPNVDAFSFVFLYWK
jgi:hypothetical protein